ncbi:MAG TPA: DUF2924 domain-containing protein [Planctomycetaceae bacterium]|nr:DUF2924 domain-containing protein [Planctomycetaceae bacterium]
MLNVAKEVSAMERMSVDELRRKFAEVCGESTNGRNKPWLIKRIAWRMQANVEGGLSERARQRAAELADDAYLRVTPPRTPKASAAAPSVTGGVRLTGDHRLPLPGALLVREYKGRTVRARVLADGFEFEGERYRSLSAVAKAATGKHWNGFHFFGLRSAGENA